MTDKQIIDLTEIDKKYKDKCSLIKAGKCKNVNIFIEQSRKLKAKEQECEELKKIINEAKNSKLDLKSFLVGEAVQNEYEQQLDQLKEELEQEKNWHKTADEISKANSEYTYKLKQTLTEIKEIAENAYCLTNGTNKDMANFAKQILQKISEVEDANI